jgi:hypothetical protein
MTFPRLRDTTPTPDVWLRRSEPTLRATNGPTALHQLKPQNGVAIDTNVICLDGGGVLLKSFSSAISRELRAYPFHRFPNGSLGESEKARIVSSGTQNVDAHNLFHSLRHSHYRDNRAILPCFSQVGFSP